MTKLPELVRDALNEVLQHGEAQLARLVDHREAFDEGLMDVCAPVVLTSVNDPELGPSSAQVGGGSAAESVARAARIGG